MNENEDGPTNVPGKGWRWANSVPGLRRIAAERAFWTCDMIGFDDVLNVREWETEGDVWTRRYMLATSNSYGDVFEGHIRIHFAPETAEVIGVDGQ